MAPARSPDVSSATSIRRIRVREVELAYEERGEGAPLVLVMGVGTQLVHWPEPFLDMLVDRGFRVIRFDNRDVGLSSKLDGLGMPRIRSLIVRRTLGLSVRPPYALRDMAADVVGLMDGLNIERAHVVGISMGGMIAQNLAIHHPHRLRTLTSMMSTTGERYAPTFPALAALLAPAPRNVQQAMDHSARIFRTFNGPTYRIDETRIREVAARAWLRCHHPPGFARQMAAIVCERPRTAALHHVHVPTLVIHGGSDPLIPPAAGRATARAIPGARLRLIEGLGHNLPRAAWPIVADAISEHARDY